MESTGEPFASSIEDQRQYDHLCRYALCLDLAPGKSVLDIAWREGYGASILATAAQSVVLLVGDGAAKAMSRGAFDTPRVRVIAGSFESIPLPDASFDMITSFGGEVEGGNDGRVLAEIRRLLKPHGSLIVDVPNGFPDRLRNFFQHIRVYEHQVASGSTVIPLNESGKPVPVAETAGVKPPIPSPSTHRLAICSNSGAEAGLNFRSTHLDPARRIFQIFNQVQASAAQAAEARGNPSRESGREREARGEPRTGDDYIAEKLLAPLRARLSRQDEVLDWIYKSNRWALGSFPYRAERFLRRLLPARSPISGVLEAPVADTTVRNVVEVSGWVRSESGPIVRLEVFLNTFYVGSVDETSDAPDGRRRYTSRFWLSGIPAIEGRMELSVRAHDRAGNRHVFTQVVNRRAPEADVFTGNLDCPAEGAVVRRFIEVTGWAFSSIAPVGRVEAFLGRERLGAVQHGLSRPDVVRVFPGAPADCGFKSFFPIEEVDGEGESLLTVRLYDNEGSTKVFTQVVSVAQSGIFGDLEIPQPDAVCSESIEISGWVYSRLSPIVSVQIFLDDTFCSNAVYGDARPDVVAAFPSKAPLMCGFRERLSLKSLNLEGRRQLRVFAQDKDGAEHTMTQTVVIRKARAINLTDESRLALERAFAEFQERFDWTPSVLDWDSGLALADEFPSVAVFSPPPGSDRSLPYRSSIVDMVVIPSGANEKIEEARRVATTAFIRASIDDVRVEWKDAGSLAPLPSTSIIIPVHNNVGYTEGCLEKLSVTLPADFQGEIIVVDDASTDETPAALTRWIERDSRIRVMRNATNEGFIKSCNRAAEAATGEYLVFLNNDTLPMPGWLPPLLRTFHHQSDAGAVGGKLVYPDGTLQEAGGVIFSDGSGCNFGRHFDPAAPLFNFVREVDYCSGALLAVRRDVFMKLGAFDLRYAPAYYEDTDLCFRLRQNGYRVFYQPLSVVIHFEGATSGQDVSTGVKKYQSVNHRKFVERWAPELKRQPSPPARYDFSSLYALSQVSRDHAG